MQEFATQHHLIAWCPAWKLLPESVQIPSSACSLWLHCHTRVTMAPLSLILWGWQHCGPQLIPLCGLEIAHSGAFLLQMPRVKSKTSSAFSLLLLCPRKEQWTVLAGETWAPPEHPSLPAASQYVSVCTVSEEGQDLKPSSYTAVVNNRCCCKKLTGSKARSNR